MSHARPSPPQVLILLAAAIFGGHAAPASAQDVDPAAARAHAGGGLLIGTPVGEFAENVGTGFGLGVFGRYALDPAGVISLRADAGLLNYGNETIRICVTQPCRVTGDLTTSNNIIFGAIGPELGLGNRALRLYVNAVAGFAYFATTSSVEGENEEGSPFASSTNFDDVTFAWIAGGGVQSLVWSGDRTAVRLDLQIRYHGNGDARYLRKGDIEDRPDGSVVINPQHGPTNLWTVQFGVSVGIPAAG